MSFAVNNTENAKKAVALLLIGVLVLVIYPPRSTSAAVAVASSSQNDNGSGTTLTISKPSGLAEGDMMIGTVYMLSAAGGSVPSGWTQLNTPHDFRQYTVSCKIADSSDVAASGFTWTANNSGNPKAGAIMRITGATTDCASITISSRSTASNTSSPSFSNGVTPAQANSLIVMAILTNGLPETASSALSSFSITTSNPGGWQTAGNLSSGNGIGVTQAYAVRTQTTGTGSYSASTGGDSSNDFWAWILAIPPGPVPPTAPTSLLTEGQTNPTNIDDSTPEFSAIYNDDDVSADKYRLQVATSTAFSTIYWDSGTTTMATTTVGSRSPDISYAGSTLASSTPYYWRVQFIDTANTVGAWSTTTASFSLAAGNNVVQNISYTYDAAGNITQIVDNSAGGVAKSVTYGYDDLHRLVTASTTAASSTPFSHTYSYNAIGNLTDNSSVGTYSYAQTGHANPHAPTTIAGTSYAYDNNGNLTSKGSSTYTWDFQNHLASAGNGVATTTNLYDDEGKRVKKTVGAVSTVFANDWFNKTGATTTIAVMLPDGTPLATIEGNGTATSTYYTHTDHLGGTNVVTNSSAAVVQALDYYPFGATRIDGGTDVSQREFIGQVYDEEAGLSYLNARHYDSARGQFLSEDPVFWEVGQTSDGKTVLQNPQLQNSYSYSTNNPIINKDPQGRCPLCIVGAIGGGVAAVGTYFDDVLKNKADGLTGLSAYMPRSSFAQYSINAGTGALGAVTLSESLLLSAGVTALGSVANDIAGGEQPNLTNAAASSVVTIATGGLVRGTVGNSSLQTAIRSGGTLTGPVLAQGYRYAGTRETFGAASTVLTLNAIRNGSQNVSNTNSSQNTTASSSQDPVLNQVKKAFNNIKRFITGQ